MTTTTTYNYLEAVKDDVQEYIENEIDLTEWTGDRDGLEQQLNDDLFINDSVTGNASGSYYCSTWKAEEALCHNLDLLGEALSEFGSDPAYLLKNGAEAADVTIRCYLLGQAISEVLDEMENEITCISNRKLPMTLAKINITPKGIGFTEKQIEHQKKKIMNDEILKNGIQKFSGVDLNMPSVEDGAFDEEEEEEEETEE